MPLHYQKTEEREQLLTHDDNSNSDSSSHTSVSSSGTEEEEEDKEQERCVDLYINDGGGGDNHNSEREEVLFIQRMKMWFIINCVVSVVWLLLFCLCIGYYVEFKKKCRNADVFGTFGLCLSAYLFLRYLFCTVIIGTTWKKLHYELATNTACTSPPSSYTKLSMFKTKRMEKTLSKWQDNYNRVKNMVLVEKDIIPPDVSTSLPKALRDIRTYFEKGHHEYHPLQPR